MKFTKVRDVKSPARGTNKAAGIDFFVPNDFQPCLIFPHCDILIPSGIKMEIPEGYMLIAADKSGIVTSRHALKKVGRQKNDAFNCSIIIGAKVIDEDYQGEINIHLINTGTSIVGIKPGMKIAQFILVPVLYEGLEEVSESEIFRNKTLSERGEGAFGSTGSY